jgi:hypothetical protein
MKTFPFALLLIAGSASACTVSGGEDDDILEEGEVTLANPDDEGKSDTVFGKSLRYMVRGEWTWTAGDRSMTTDTEVLFQSKDTVRVRALRVSIGVPRDEVLELSVDAESFNDLGDISTDVAFILWTTDASHSYWMPTYCSQNYFERVVIDPSNREMDVVAHGAGGDTARTFSFSECGIPDDVSQVAIFPFPSRGWWSLEGYYNLKIEADCGTSVCPAGKYLPSSY